MCNFCVCLLSLSECNIYKVHPQLQTCISQNFIPFGGWMIFHCRERPQIFIHSSADGLWVVSTFFIIMSNAAVNIHVQIFVWTHAFNSLQCMYKSGIPGLHVVLISKMWFFWVKLFMFAQAKYSVLKSVLSQSEAQIWLESMDTSRSTMAVSLWH